MQACILSLTVIVTMCIMVCLNIISALAEDIQNNDIGTVDRVLQYDAVGCKNFNVNVKLQNM